jgi:hypothetical protein
MIHVFRSKNDGRSCDEAARSAGPDPPTTHAKARTAAVIAPATIIVVAAESLTAKSSFRPNTAAPKPRALAPVAKPNIPIGSTHATECDLTAGLVSVLGIEMSEMIASLAVAGLPHPRHAGAKSETSRPQSIHFTSAIFDPLTELISFGFFKLLYLPTF